MGPRARARGNEVAWCGLLDTAELQWGHERALVEMKARQIAMQESKLLQWGHERALVEIAAPG